MKKVQRTLLLGGTIVALGFVGIAATIYNPQEAVAEAPKGGAPAAPPAIPVDVNIIKYEPVQLWNEYSGRLHAVDSVELRPQVSGAIMEIKFHDGQIVAKGEVLFIIDPRPYKAALDQAQADLQKSKNEYTLEQKNLKRAQELIKTKAIAERLLDEQKSTTSVAKSAVDAMQAQVNQAQLNLDYTSVTAPISGRTGRAEITVGNLVQIGSPILTTIVSNEGIYADFEVDEKTYLKLMQDKATAPIGEKFAKIPVKLTIGRDKDTNAELLEGYIESFDNRIDTSSGTIRARALLENKNGALLPGMFVNVSMGSPSDEEEILVSSDAIGTDQDRKFVYVVGDDNKVQYREVMLGGSANGKRIVTDGLKPGEKVISGGIMKLRPDVVVEPKVQAAAVSPAQKIQAMKTEPKSIIESKK